MRKPHSNRRNVHSVGPGYGCACEHPASRSSWRGRCISWGTRTPRSPPSRARLRAAGSVGTWAIMHALSSSGEGDVIEPCPGRCLDAELDGTFMANVSRSKSVFGTKIWVRFLVTHQFNSTSRTGVLIEHCPIMTVSLPRYLTDAHSLSTPTPRTHPRRHRARRPIPVALLPAAALHVHRRASPRGLRV